METKQKDNGFQNYYIPFNKGMMIQKHSIHRHHNLNRINISNKMIKYLMDNLYLI